MRFRVKWGIILVALAVLPFFLVTCGIDDEPYLREVDPSNVVVEANTSARVTVTVDNDEKDYSPHFLLYYKIYISGQSESGTISSGDMSRINATLDSDYSNINYYTPLNTSNRPVFTPTVFSNRNFYAMLINSSETFSETGNVTINFDNQSSNPSLSLNGKPALTLQRSNGNGSFVPLPEDNRYFRNFSELQNTQNRDVAQSSSGTDYSYCAVYIIKRGTNPTTLTAIYSAPTFVAVFRLPDRY
jgi:hypothetical protein